MKRTDLFILLFLTVISLLLSACSGDSPRLTHFAAINERYQTVYETTSTKDLAEISDLLYDRYQSNESAADFKYLLDLTIAEGTKRWRCSANGYCQERLTDDEAEIAIYRLERYRELYEKINLISAN